MEKNKHTNKLSFHLKICNSCDKKDCKKGLFSTVFPKDCPYMLEKMLGDQDL